LASTSMARAAVGLFVLRSFMADATSHNRLPRKPETDVWVGAPSSGALLLTTPNII
jgi:hypothetical protein